MPSLQVPQGLWKTLESLPSVERTLRPSPWSFGPEQEMQIPSFHLEVPFLLYLHVYLRIGGTQKDV